jgi:alpha,alpha-trehalose phosphorylase
MDLGDLQGNTTDGVHIASAGGVWMAIVHGFAGFSQSEGRISFEPRLPDDWNGLRFQLRMRNSTLRVDLNHHRLSLHAEGEPLDIEHGGATHTIDNSGREFPTTS